MIIAERKPFEEIKEQLKGYHHVLVLGCGTCTSVCMAGGEKEVGLLATELRMVDRKNGGNMEISEATIQRQCDKEYIEALPRKDGGYDAILSMACGAGVQLTAEVLEPVPVFPALNTRFIGVTEEEGVWAQRCLACGECLLADFGGICPVTLCTKGLINGPCGGAKEGKCEARDGRDCAWELIYNRLKKQGRLENLRKVRMPRSNARQDHPARQVAEAYMARDATKSGALSH